MLTSKKDDIKLKDQLLLSYNVKREPIKLQTRNNFLNSNEAKVVVWAFVFTDDKRILLHRRKDNAKDNRGLWDKSVGGHVERSDLESSTAIAREVAEELYTDECLGNQFENNIIVDKMSQKMKFLGEWEKQKTKLDADETCFKYFRVNYEFSKVLINSHRLLPNGEKATVNFFADVFFFLAPKSFAISDLKNSDYILIDLYDLKEAANNGFFPDSSIACNFTPDLKYIVDSPLWEDLLNFSKSI